MLDILTENMHEHGGGGGVTLLSHALLAIQILLGMSAGFILLFIFARKQPLLTNPVCRCLVGGVYLRTVSRTMLSTGASR